MPAFPATLPVHEGEPYALNPAPLLARMEVEQGPARQRRRFSTAPTRIPIAWEFTRAQMAEFETWHRFDLDDGELWFDINLSNGQGITEVSARFTGQPEKKVLEGLRWRVSAQLEVRQMPLMTEAALDLLL